MHRLMRPLLASLFVAAFSTIAFAEPATTAPATQPAADSETTTPIKPEDKDAITANIDKEVVLEGTIDNAAWSSTGKVMIAKFKSSEEKKLQAVIFVKNREKFDSAFSGDVAKALNGAKVRLKGKLKEFKGSPEIVLDNVDQVTIVEPAPAAS